MTLGETAVVPILGGGGTGTGAGLGIGGGVLGGAVAGALTGMLTGGRGFGGWNGGAAPVAGAVATDLLLNPAFQGIQTQIQTLQAQVGANDLRNEMESMENTFATITSGQTAANAANFNNINDKIGQVQTSQAAGNFTTLESINNLARDLTASGTQALINSIQNFNQLQNSQTLATSQITAQLSAMAATNAECCCDLKNLITSDGNQTRALINNNTIQALRDANVALAGEVSNFKQNQFLINKLSSSVVI
jgi:hypothetical protein